TKPYKSNNILYLVLFLAICVIYAFSNVLLLSMGIQLFFVSLIIIYLLRVKKINISIHFIWMSSFLLSTLLACFFAYNIDVAIIEIVNLSLKFLFYTALIILIDTEEKFDFVIKAL